ncbi:MAG: 2-C-methyl-D-erythritol 4-phosphate cytidylyltransferase [Bacteroidales bacterium]|jgi:2-C-methyl-D-erythritol 4-phosphate cytidylyltransferase|nr:2-C-methyl-D-erythritol 4-phosphate cytidylyltransferase [Bacteroidales bacterium]
MKLHLLIVAGGSGQRMKTTQPKQFLLLDGLPMLMRSIQAFTSCIKPDSITIVLPENQIPEWQKHCMSYNFQEKHKTVSGGIERFFSVKKGLENLPDEGLVLIHDGVRPLVSEKTINNCIKIATHFGSAIPVVPPTESLRELDEDGISRSVDRSRFQLVQTPQVFDLPLIKQAYTQEYSPLFTDDASVFESVGNKVKLVEGNPENIKITHPRDIAIAETLIQIMK